MESSMGGFETLRGEASEWNCSKLFSVSFESIILFSREAESGEASYICVEPSDPLRYVVDFESDISKFLFNVSLLWFVRISL